MSYTRADLMKVDPWQVRTGDLIAQAGPQGSDRYVGWRVTSAHPHRPTSPDKPSTTWIEFDAGTWQGHFDQPDTIPVWIIRRDLDR